MLIAQISAPHIKGDGVLAYGHIRAWPWAAP
jgi:hypothetical protein